MSRRLLISALPGERRAAWIEGERLVDLIVARDDRPSLAGNVYLGRVGVVDRPRNAAFVDVGLARPGFLPLDEAPRGLSQGDAVVVRVRREPTADKGARLSARRGDIPADLATAAQSATPPALLRPAEDPVMAALARLEAVDEIRIDDPQIFAAARRRLADRPHLRARLVLDLEPAPLFERAGVEAAIEALLHPRVPLPGGGALLIEPVRTLCAIDVDTGHDATAGAGRAARVVNLEAAAEIPRQVRLRNLSGLIVIDFLTPPDARTRADVVTALKRGFADDGRAVRIHAMRPSGLVEMTRRRVGLPLHEMLSDPCGIGGGGRVPDATSLAFAALRAVRR
ncbi:MAG: hypothetical protein D6826_11550, partial [Alphaproteobacteria bacterium]